MPVLTEAVTWRYSKALLLASVIDRALRHSGLYQFPLPIPGRSHMVRQLCHPGLRHADRAVYAVLTLGGAIATALWISLLAIPPALSDTLNPSEFGFVKAPGLFADASAIGSAQALAGTVAAPYEPVLLKVPTPPTAANQSHLRAIGGGEPGNARSSTSDWLLEIKAPDRSDSWFSPVVHPAEQPAANHVTVGIPAE